MGVYLYPFTVSAIIRIVSRQVILKVWLLILGTDDTGRKGHLLLIVLIKLAANVLSHVNYFSRVFKLACRSYWVKWGHIEVL